MAKNNIDNNKLTPSAKEALDVIMRELHETLMSKANYFAQNGQTIDKEISLHDIREARDSLFQAKLDNGNADHRRRKMMKFIILTGISYSIAGIFVCVIYNKSFIIENKIGLFIIFTDLLIILIGFIYLQLSARKYDKKHQYYNSMHHNSDNDFVIIENWQIIEKLGSKLMRQKGFSYNESRYINDILKFLSEELKSDKLKKEMRDLLSVRNRIIHEGLELGRNEKQLYLENADKIIKSLEKLEK